MIIDAPKEIHLSQLKRLWQQAFGDSDREIDLFFESGYSPERCRIAIDKDSVLGALYWFPCSWEGKPLAYLYAIATDAAHQNQGICTKLIADTHRYLASLGFSGTVLVPGTAELFSFYEKLGYRTFGGLTKHAAVYGSTPLPFQKINAAKYADLRKALLPAGSILQEDAFLPLLEVSLDFYAGDNWLLAGKKTWQHFEGAEYLGNPENLPGILCALNVSNGTFRSPGSDLPFAMFHSLVPEQTLPGYFAFALD